MPRGVRLKPTSIIITPIIKAAIRYLVSARNRRGWWQDFDTLAGPSDEWVTAYVGTALASVPDALALGTARKAWDLLRKRRFWSAGWGYNGWVPADADSTAWAVMLALALGVRNSIRVRRAHRFLAGHIHQEGGICTFKNDGPIRHFTRLQRHISFRGWCKQHVCVTAAVANLDEFNLHPHMRTYLRRTQSQDGSWPAYWWCDNEYATGLAVEALTKNMQPEDIYHVQRAVQWACGRVQDGFVSSMIHTSGSPFATAWCLRLLVLATDAQRVRQPLEHALNWILRNQRQDGSWQPSTTLRIPPPDVIEPAEYQSWIINGRGGGSIVLDNQGIFTTSTVLKALNIVNEYMRKHEHSL